MTPVVNDLACAYQPTFLCLHVTKAATLMFVVICVGAKPSDGVPDMTVISEIDEYGINENLKVRYHQNKIYVSYSNHHG